MYFQLLDSELQPVINWLEGKTPTQNEVQFQGKNHPHSVELEGLASNAKCGPKRDSPQRTIVCKTHVVWMGALRPVEPKFGIIHVA